MKGWKVLFISQAVLAIYINPLPAIEQYFRESEFTEEHVVRLLLGMILGALLNALLAMRR